MYRKKSHISFTYGNHTDGSVYWLSVFLTLPLLLNFCMERILSTMVQPTDKGKLAVTKFIQNVYRILTWLPYVPSDVITYF